MGRFSSVLFLLCAVLIAPVAAAHEARPALIDIAERAPGKWRITWKQPVMGERALRLVPHLSNGWLARQPTGEDLTSSHYLRRWEIAAPASELDGAQLTVDGLGNSITDVLVRLRRAGGGDGETTILRGEDPRMTIRLEEKASFAVPAYLGFGVRHILVGIDHLLFVLGLLLLVGSGWRLVSAITAFTLAHSVTLAASVLGIVAVPVTVIEALIAWSVVFVAFELTRGSGKGQGLMRRWPWIVALVFGLLHGFGFAGALAETGLPENDIPLALLLFNIGVEIGQLLFVGAALLLAAVWRRLVREQRQPIEVPTLRRLAAYGMGCYASFLFFERTAAAFA